MGAGASARETALKEGYTEADITKCLQVATNCNRMTSGWKINDKRMVPIGEHQGAQLFDPELLKSKILNNHLKYFSNPKTSSFESLEGESATTFAQNLESSFVVSGKTGWYSTKLI